MPSAVTISFASSLGDFAKDAIEADMPVRSSIKNALRRGGRIAADSLHVHHHHGRPHFHRTGKEAALHHMAVNPPAVERHEAPRVELPIDVIILIVEEVRGTTP